MKKLLALVLLFTAACALVATVARIRASSPKPDATAENATAVDVDFTTLNDTMRSVKIVELMKDPLAFKDKSIRLDGVAVYGEDDDGTKLYGLQVYDAGGCCPLLTLEYLPTSTNALPPRSEFAVLEGRFVIRDPPARPRVIITNATIRVKQLPTSVL